jgi:hypothetical protein
MTFAVVLLTLTLGCDRGNSPIGPSPFQFVGSPFLSGGPSLSILIVSGGSLLTTTVFPATPLTVPRGATLSCISSDNTTQPPRIAGTINPGIVAPAGRPVTLPDAGTFTFGCALRPEIIVTIIVV